MNPHRLQNLPRMDKLETMKQFIKEQRSNLTFYAAQGRQDFDSGEAEKLHGAGGNCVTSSRDQHLDVLAGIGTPVLTARQPRVPSEPIAHSSVTKAVHGHGETRILKGVHQTAGPTTKSRHSGLLGEVDSNEGKAAKAKKTKKSTKEPRPSHTVRSQVEQSESEESEHAKRLKERRERRKARRDIVKANDGREEPPSQCPDDKENNMRSGDRKNASNKLSKPRVPAGLALMHGFKATNVGKSRLTMERSVGVFSKGIASKKTAANRGDKRTPKPRFSETRFLEGAKGNRPNSAKESAKKAGRKRALSSTHSGSTNHSSVSKTTSPSQSRADKRRREKSPVHKVKHASDPELAEHSSVYKLRSEIWDIERESADLPSTVDSIRVKQPLANSSRNLDHGYKSSTSGPPSESAAALERPRSAKASSISLVPSDSASRLPANPTTHTGDMNCNDHQPVVSRFFQTLIPPEPHAGVFKHTKPDSTIGKLTLGHRSSASVAFYSTCGPLDRASSVHEGIIPPEVPFERGHEDDPISGYRSASTPIRGYQSASLLSPSSFAMSDYHYHPYDPLLSGEVPFEGDTGYRSDDNFNITPFDDQLACDTSLQASTVNLTDTGVLFDHTDVDEAHNFDSCSNFEPGRTLVPEEQNIYVESTGCALYSACFTPEGYAWPETGHEDEQEFSSFDDNPKVASEASEASNFVGDTVNSEEDEQVPLCNFLQGRSLLFGGVPLNSGGLGEQVRGDFRHSKFNDQLGRVESDVAKNLKDHWLPQRL